MTNLLIVVVMATTTAVVLGVDYPATHRGGICVDDVVCPCGTSVSENATRNAVDVTLQFRGIGNPLQPQSVFKRPSHRSSAGVVETQSIVSGAPLLPIVLEFLPSPANMPPSTCPSFTTTNADTLYPGTSYQDPVPYPMVVFNETVFVSNRTVRVVADDASSVRWSFAANYSAAASGVIVIENFTVTAPAGVELYFVINTSIGLWTLSPLLVMFDSVASSSVHLRLLETGNNWISTLPCFSSPLVLEGQMTYLSTADLTFAIENLAGYINNTVDGSQLSVKATLQDSRSGTLVVDTNGNEFVVRSGFVSVFGALTVHWARPTSEEETSEPASQMADLPFRFQFSVPGLEPLYSTWMKLTTHRISSYALVFSPSSYLQGELSSGGNGAAAAAVIGSPLRRVVVNVVSIDRWRSLGASSSGRGVFVVAKCNGAELSGNYAAVRGGVAVFDSLIITSLLPPPPMPYSKQRTVVITFSVQPADAVRWPRPLWSETIVVTSSDDVLLSQPFLRLRHFLNQLRPSDSASTPLMAPRVGRFAKPIAIDVVGANGLVDPAAAECHSVVARGPLLVSPISVQPTSGVALFMHFEWDLALASATSTAFTSLQFSCAAAAGDTNEGLAPLSVSPIWLVPNNSAVATIQFQPSSLNWVAHTFQDAFGVHGVSLPQVIVEVLGVDGVVDVEIDDMVVFAVGDDGVTVSGGVAWVRQGRAMFPDLTLYCNAPIGVSGCATRLHFQVDPSMSNAPVSMPTRSMILSTGIVSVTNGVVGRFGLKFLPSSFIAFSLHTPRVAFGYPLPSIGLGIFRSDHSADRSATGLLVRVSLTSGTLSGTVTAVADEVNGQFWFHNIIVTTASAPLEPRFHFCVERDPSVQSSVSLSQYAAVIGRCVSSGVAVFVLPDTPVGLKLVAAARNDGAPLIPGGVDDHESLYIVSTNGSLVCNPRTTAVQLRVSVLNAANRVALPTASAMTRVAMDTTFSASAAFTELAVDRRPQVYPSSPFATFANVLFAEAVDVVAGAVEGALLTPVRGVTHQMIVTASDWLPWNPLYVGTLAYSLNTSYATDIAPVLRVVVDMPINLFVVNDWVGQLALALRCSEHQIDVLRVQEAASGGSANSIYWAKTSVELMFSLPRSSDLITSTPLELTKRLLDWKPVCEQYNLRILHVYRQTDIPPYCDVLRLQDQVLMAQMCYATSETTANLCSCFAPVFERLSAQCFSSTVIAEVCTVLDRCALSNAAIEGGCAEYQSNLTLQYVMIGVYTLAATLVVILFSLWYQGVFNRCWRNTLGNRNRRDIEYEGLRQQRAKGEFVEIDTQVF